MTMTKEEKIELIIRRGVQIFNEDSLSDMSPAVFGLTNQKITKIETVKSSNNRIVY